MRRERENETAREWRFGEALYERDRRTKLAAINDRRPVLLGLKRNPENEATGIVQQRSPRSVIVALHFAFISTIFLRLL